MKEIRYNFNGKILTMALIGVIMVCSSILMQLYNPLQLITNKLLTLEPGSLLFKLWADPPYEVTLKLYIFNVTNSEEFIRGEEKLNVTEIGPFCYREILTHVNATVNYDDGTLTYTPNREYIVDLDCSIMDPKLAKIIAPNIPLLGIQSYLIDMSFLTNIGFSTLSATLGAKSFVNITTHEYFWGYEDKLVSLANQFVPNWIDFGTFGIIERLLSRDNINEVTISIDPTKHKSRYAHLLTADEQSAQFHITKWNNLEGFPEWGYKSENEFISTTKRCHLVEGDFDGTIYPRPMKKNSTITMFRKAFCRPITLVFDEESLTKQGFRSYNYKVSKNLFESPELNSMNECYCRNNGKICPRDGVQDIGVCYYDMPILLSKPHFLDSPRRLVEEVNGIRPDEKRHSSVAKLQPDLGIPLDGSSLKIQVNLGVGETKYNTKTKPFNNLTVPILWLELTCQKLPPLVTFLLKLVIDILPISQKILIYLTGLIGLTLISGAALVILFFSKNVVPRSMSIVSDYAALPLITIPANFLKEKELRIYK